MRIAEIKQLHKGDEVTWNDPDEDRYTRVYKINKIEFFPPNRVRITEDNGSFLECFARELSWNRR